MPRSSTAQPTTPTELAIKVKGGRTGRVELISVCRRMAIEEGTTLEVMLWDTIKGVAHWARNGDAACAKLMLTLFARDDSTTLPDVSAAAKDAELGPPVPRDPAHYAELGEKVIAELELLG